MNLPAVGAVEVVGVVRLLLVLDQHVLLNHATGRKKMSQKLG